MEFYNCQYGIYVLLLQLSKCLKIHTVLEHYGIKKNRNKMVCCPFHDDKNPSMQVYADTNTVFCFSGNCKMNGKKIDAIQFIQDKENIIKHEAIKKAQSMIKQSIQPIQAKPIIQTENLTEIFSKLKQTQLQQAEKLYHLSIEGLIGSTLEKSCVMIHLYVSLMSI